MQIKRSIHEPIRTGLSMEARWKSSDDGLIAAWERGRAMSAEDPELAAKTRAGALVSLPWRGGVPDPPPKTKTKPGTFRYLAMWQGLRGDDLNIDTDAEVVVWCSASGLSVTFSKAATLTEDE
jgi:hypothetical protein